jgi:hypothetical protein
MDIAEKTLLLRNDPTKVVCNLSMVGDLDAAGIVQDKD